VIGLIAAGLWAISPWAIAVSRTVREYAIFPFFYVFIFIFLVRLRNVVLDVLEHRRSINLSRSVLYGIGFIAPIMYGEIDHFSTFKQITLLYVAFAAYLLFGILRSSFVSTPAKRELAAISIAGVAVIFFSPLASYRYLSKLPSFDPYFMKLVFFNVKTLWYSTYGLIGFYIVFGIGVFAAIISLLKNKFHVVGFALLSFMSTFYFLTFHYARYNRPRYGFNLHIWLIPLIAIGLYISYRAIFSKTDKSAPMFAVLFIGVALFVFNPINTYRAFTMNGGGYAGITKEFHHEYLPLLEKYGSQIQRDDVIICSLCSPLIWHNQVDLADNNLHHYKKGDEERFAKVARIVDANEHGWIIMDKRRNSDKRKGFPHENLVYGDKEVTLLEQLGTFYIYRW